MSARVTAAVLLALLAAPSAAGALDVLRPGMKAPEFQLERFEGGSLGTRDVAGARVVVLAFWATWSDKSAEALRRLEALHGRYRAQGLVVLGVNVESASATAEDLARASALARATGVGFPLLVDRGLATFGAYGVVAVPSMVALRADLTILAELSSYPLAGREEFFEAVEAAIVGTTAPRPPADARTPNVRALRYYNLARTLGARGHTEQAIQTLRTAIQLDPAFASPFTALGGLLRERAVGTETVRLGGESGATVRIDDAERARLLAEAERALDAALALAPDDVAALTELAAVRVARGDPAAARALLDRALAAKPGHAPARAQLGAILLRAGDVDRGRVELEDAARLNPLDWRLAALAAQAYEERGMTADAMRHYRRGAELLWEARREPFTLAPAAR